MTYQPKPGTHPAIVLETMRSFDRPMKTAEIVDATPEVEDWKVRQVLRQFRDHGLARRIDGRTPQPGRGVPAVWALVGAP